MPRVDHRPQLRRRSWAASTALRCPLAKWLPLSLVLVMTARGPARATVLALTEVEQDGVGGVSGLRGALAVAVSPDGAHLYVAGSDDNAVTAFRRNPATGGLTFVEAQVDRTGGVDGLNGLVGTSALAISPDGAHVYAASAADSAVAVFRRDSATGGLTFIEAQRNGGGGVTGLGGAWGVTVSPDGAHVYAASYLDRAVAAFRRNTTTGRLTFIEARVNGSGGLAGLDDP